MNLYILRHAHAVDAADDPERPLSARGRKQVRTLAAFLKQSDALVTREVWHSPLARSGETAELLIKKLGLEANLVEIDGLQPEDDPQLLTQRFKNRQQPLAIVGHDPQLSALVSFLVTGSTEPSRFILKKCTIIALERTEGVWTVRWQISPELLT
jgi:phosphohistidine phosphatase